MRYVRYVCIAVFAVGLVVVAMANRGFVELNVLPAEIAGMFAVAPSVRLPLFIVILGGILIGLLVGRVWEWIHEHAQRAEAARTAREMRRLQREIKQLKGEKHAGKDEVLALLEEAS